MGRPGLVVAVGLAAALGVAGSAAAQSPATISVTPAEADPGATVFVTNGSGSPCTPPLGALNASASVDLFAPGAATPANRLPYQGRVSSSGSWTVEVRLAPDLAPGRYRVQAGCYTDSGLNSGFGPSYQAGALELRLHTLGQPTVNTRTARPGDSVQVTSGDVRCPPPVGSPSPRVRVSLVDSGGATRAESEGAVDPSGRWSLSIRVPSIGTEDVQAKAVCLARVGAPSPYARYAGSSFKVEVAAQPDPPLAPPTTPAPTASTAPGAPAPTIPNPALVEAASLPPAPVATPIVAEPTYTG